MTSVARLAVVQVGVLALLPMSRADELRIFERHDSQQSKTTGPERRGFVQLHPDATYRGEQQLPDGQVMKLGGLVRIVEDRLELNRDGQWLSFRRDDAGEQVRWRHKSPEFEWLLVQPGHAESTIDLLARLTSRGGALNWVLRDNLGFLDRAPQGLILRSKEPSPEDIDRLIASWGLKTVISLNGKLDKEVICEHDERSLLEGEQPQVRRVRMYEFIAAKKLTHHTFEMSARKAPTAQQLEGIFRLLVDDSLKPILLHCRGGSDRTGIISALYEVEFLGLRKADAKQRMREHMWMAHDGTEIQGAYLDLYQPGLIRKLLRKNCVDLSERYRIE